MIELKPITNRPGLSLVTAQQIDDALALLRANPGRITIQFVQRHLLISYNQAARILEHFERQGVITPQLPNGTREFVDSSAIDGADEDDAGLSSCVGCGAPRYYRCMPNCPADASNEKLLAKKRTDTK